MAMDYRVHQAAVGRMRNPAQGDRILVLDGDLEVVTGRQMKLLPHGQHKLAFLGKHSRQEGYSYLFRFRNVNVEAAPVATMFLWMTAS